MGSSSLALPSITSLQVLPFNLDPLHSVTLSDSFAYCIPESSNSFARINLKKKMTQD